MEALSDWRMAPGRTGRPMVVLSRPASARRGGRFAWLAGLTVAFAVTTFVAREARAEVEIVNNHGWSLSTDGRVNIFLSIARGAAIPKNEQNYTGLNEEFTPDNNLESARMRTGFIMSVLGFNLRKTLAVG